jgi:hypothetical protein
MARWLRSHHELDADVHRESSYREALCDSCVDTRVVGFYGCDPVINVAGAKFHAWLFCVAVVAALFRLLFIALRIDHPLAGSVGLSQPGGPGGERRLRDRFNRI